MIKHRIGPIRILTIMLSALVTGNSGIGRVVPSHAAVMDARCKVVTKKVHGHKKKVRVCTHARATPTPTPALFAGPSDIVVDPAGDILVADQHHRRIVTLSPSGTVIANWTLAGNNPAVFDTLYGIAQDRTGNIFVTDAANHLVDKLDSTGKPLAQWSTDVAGPGSFPTLLAAAANGDILVCDYKTTSVLRLSSTGALLSQIGKGQFTNPYAVAIGPDANLYVTDFGGNRVDEYSPDGVQVAHWGDGSTGKIRLQAPEAIAVDASGALFVTEQLGDVVKFDRSGTELGRFGSSPTTHFDDPSGIALDPQGNIYVSDFVGNVVEKLSATGAVLAVWK